MITKRQAKTDRKTKREKGNANQMTKSIVHAAGIHFSSLGGVSYVFISREGGEARTTLITQQNNF